VAARIVRLADEELKFDPTDIDVVAALRIKAHTGKGLVSWLRACDDLDPVAMQAAVWLVFHQNGQDREIGLLNFNLLTVYQALFGKE
jgi:hypothetical protein